MSHRTSLVILFFWILFFSSCSSPKPPTASPPLQHMEKPEKVPSSKKVIEALSEKDGLTESDTEDDDEDSENEEDDFGGFDDFEEEFSKAETYDPLEGYNRFMTDFNDGLYIYLLDPVARGYRYVLPKSGRRAVERFIDNVLFPVRFSGSILQAKFDCAGIETTRFIINTTIGLLGFFDPAKAWLNLKGCNEDIGQAIGYWDVGPGPHVVLPFFGPSNLRDALAMYPESYVDPISQMRPFVRYAGATAYKAVNYTSLHIGEYESFKRDAVDFYILVRDAYEQLRKNKIKE